MKSSWFSRCLSVLVDWQIRRPVLVVSVVLLSLLPAGWSASKLGLRTAFSELLPDNKPSVVELRRVNQRIPSQSTLTIVAEANGPELLKAYADAITPKLMALGPGLVRAVDTGPKAVEEFLRDRKHLYAKTEDIQRLRDEVVSYYDATVAKQAGFDLGFDDEEDEPKATPSAGEKKDGRSRIERIVGELEQQVKTAEKAKRGQEGYYLGENGKLLAVLVRTALGSGDSRAQQLREQIEAMTRELKLTEKDPTFRIHFTGNLITSAETQQAVVSDLTEVGVLGVGLVLGIILLYFLHLRPAAAIGINIAVGLVWAFAVAQLTVGYLNTATGFLVSIIAGNGVNFSIIYTSRYAEARRDEQLDVPTAIRRSQEDTWQPTLAAAASCMIAYGSLAATDFRGFKHFGIIGGAGMLLCWTVTYLLLPALLVLMERIKPLFVNEPAWRQRVTALWGSPFAWAVRRGPKLVAVVGLGLGVVATALSVVYFAQDPMEYNMRNVRNDPSSPTSAGALNKRVDKIVGREGQDGRAIVVDRIDQVKPLLAELDRRLAVADAQHKPFDKTLSIYDLVPGDQDKKIELLGDITDRIQRARNHGAVSDADWAKLSPHLPKELKTIDVADLPEAITRPFTEKDGTRGTIVYIVPRTGRSVYDAHYLRDFAAAFREVRLPNGEVIRGTGDPVIFTDMLTNVGEDAPRAILLSLLGTLAVVFVAFRGRPSAWAALGSLLLGMAWFIGCMQLMHVKLNFLNFVAVPISIGVGADYGLNVMKRCDLLGKGALERLIVETGGAVLLCSLTTQLGYFALLSSINGAVRSFGLAAAIGEITTLLAAVLVLPAFLAWQYQKQQRKVATPAVSTGE